jgi:4-carboxymuconolactone decarboxylase
LEAFLSRLKDIKPEDLTPHQKEVFEHLTAGRGKILTPYRVWIHSPDVAASMEKTGTYINKRSALSFPEVEMGILIIARHWKSAYVTQAHILLGREAGLSEEVLDDLVAGRRPTLKDPHQQAAHDFMAGVIAENDFTEEEFASFEKILGRRGIADALVLLGYYSSVALAMRLHKVPLK